MKQLVALLLVGSVLVGCGCGSGGDDYTPPSMTTPKPGSTPNEPSNGPSTQIRKIGEVKKN